jgi:HEAT repeat protein
MKIYSEARSRYAQQNAKDSENPGDPDYRGWRLWRIIHRTFVGLGNESLPLLRALLNDGNESVRTDAADFIAEISNKKKDGKSIN